MKDNEIVELSEDHLKMRPRVTPDKWPLEGAATTFSTLKVDVPEFVPGKAYSAPGQSLSLPKETGMLIERKWMKKLMHFGFKLAAV